MKTTARLRICLLAALAVLTIPQLALAWGSVTHVGLATSVLAEAAALPAAVAALLLKNRLSYLYGSVAADVVFAKRLSRIKQFCHHWSTGFKLLDSAEDDRSKAFALGYLSHLAADTVAHGKYVPRQVMTSGQNVNLGHLYWEVRADAMQKPVTWQRMRLLNRQDHAPHFAVLEQHLRNTLLSFGVNRFLFQGISAVASTGGFQRTLARVDRHSRWPLSGALLRGYQAESVDRILSLLKDGRRSPVLREDPNGTSALMNVHVLRREERRLVRRGFSVEQRRREFSSAFAPVIPMVSPVLPSAALISAEPTTPVKSLAT